MSNNKQKEMTISELAQEMRSGFQAVREEVFGVRKEMREKISGLENYMRQGFELMDAKIDAVDQKIEHKIEFLQEGLFTMLMESVRLPNRFLKPEVIEVE